MLMAKRFFCCWTVAVFALLIVPGGVAITAPGVWAAVDQAGAGPSNFNNTPAPAAPLIAATSPRRAHKKTSSNRRVLSPFVRLAQRIDAELPLCTESLEDGDEALTIHGSDCLRQEPALRWAFARPPWQESKRWADLAAVDVSQRLLRQPLNIASAPLSPWLPTDLALVSEQEWLLDPLELINTGEGQLAASPDLPLDRREAPFAYHLGLNRQSALIAGLGWIDDVSDTTGMNPAYERSEGNEPAGTVGAVNVILGASIDAFTLTGGYLHAVDRRNEVTGVDASGEDDPTAWNSELAYRTRWLDRKTTLAVGYQKASDAYSRYFPEERYTTRASIHLFDDTTLSLEYYQDREMSSKNNLDGDDTYGITTKFGFDF